MMCNLFATGLLFVCLAGIWPAQFSRAGVIPPTSLPEQGRLVRELVNHRNALREGAAKVQRGETDGSDGKELAEYMINEMKRRTPVTEGDKVVEPRALGSMRNGERGWLSFLCYYYPSYCYAGCASHEFQCANGLCIPGYWECDNWNDCGDLSDEVNCACAEDEFRCVSGGCIPDYWQCDQYLDCSDASDEQGCTGSVSPPSIPEADSGCGTRHPVQPPSIHRIVGGQDAVRGAWPWYAQLQFLGSFHCGGTLVDSKYIITAAHCVYGSDHNVSANWSVVLGKNSENDRDNDKHFSNVIEIIIHESYDDDTVDNDIAVMVLASPPPEDNQLINSACLDTAGSVSFDRSSTCFIAGFGTTEEDGRGADVLQEATVPLVSRGDCNIPYDGQITENMICAGYPEGGIDSCQGDSGGPLVCSRRDELADVERWYLTGITSWGNGCARANYPGVYTNMASYGQWLENVFAAHNASWTTV